MGSGNKSHSIISMSLSVCLFSGSLFLHLSISPSVSLSLSSLGGRKIKVFCFLCKIFVYAFWCYLKIKLSLIRCLSFSVCKQSDVWKTLLSAFAIIKLEITLRDAMPSFC